MLCNWRTPNAPHLLWEIGVAHNPSHEGSDVTMGARMRQNALWCIRRMHADIIGSPFVASQDCIIPSDVCSRHSPHTVMEGRGTIPTYEMPRPLPPCRAPETL